jgi:hypothetical protein
VAELPEAIVKWCRTAAEANESLPAAADAAASDARPFGSGLAWKPSKTDEVRGQPYEASFFRQMRGLPYYVTLKYNGESMTVGPRADGAGRSISSRKLEIDPASENKNDRRFLRVGATVDVPDAVVVQAEVIGPGIQGNEHALDAVDYRIFSAFDARTGEPFAFDRLAALPQVRARARGGESFDNADAAAMA